MVIEAGTLSPRDEGRGRAAAHLQRPVTKSHATSRASCPHDTTSDVRFGRKHTPAEAQDAAVRGT